MARTRNVVKTIQVETAIGKRKCHSNSKHSIEKGEMHLAVYEGEMRENICLECAPKILDVADEHMAAVRKKLNL